MEGHIPWKIPGHTFQHRAIAAAMCCGLYVSVQHRSQRMSKQGHPLYYTCILCGGAQAHKRGARA
jgi:hypothetical protein